MRASLRLVRIYDAAIVFEQLWPNGATDIAVEAEGLTASGGLAASDQISSAFPSFALAGCEGKLGYLTWGNHQSGWGEHDHVDAALPWASGPANASRDRPAHASH